MAQPGRSGVIKGALPNPKVAITPSSLVIPATDHELFVMSVSGGVQIFDLSSGKWRRGTSAPELRVAGGGAVDGKVVVFGLVCGGACRETATVGMAAYDVAHDTWTERDPGIGRTSSESFGVGTLGTVGSGLIVGTAPALVAVAPDLSVKRLPDFPANFGRACLVNKRIYVVLGSSVGAQPGQTVSSTAMTLQFLDLSHPDEWRPAPSSGTDGMFGADTRSVSQLCDSTKGPVLIGGGTGFVYAGSSWHHLADGAVFDGSFASGVTTSRGKFLAVAGTRIVELGSSGSKVVTTLPAVAGGGDIELLVVGPTVVAIVRYSGGRTADLRVVA